MIENKKLEALLSRFPEDVQEIFSQMIISYQLGYVDYVYQTKDVSVQNRRIRHLIKNLRRMDYFYVMPMTQELMVSVINDWHYPEPFENCTLTRQDAIYQQWASSRDQSENLLAIIRNGAHIGYAWTDTIEENGIHLGFALKPSLIGKGLGPGFYQAIESYLRENRNITFIEVSLLKDNNLAKSFLERQNYSVFSSQSDNLVMRKEMEGIE
ncbi:GNAT family N-acetyltransferase [Streptococcus saliviloxodontae]|uniref:Ribosomal-protein-alanine N-acetyltransferase n=1 Tax=Streptococcus saliviloxodontae TaxID=1349416 RepID=A0ABS2PNG7_9STRE|nr:ribosomal-protein-alanine N-acetyltransferase [Streptococcus saliviloxodontae]